MKMEKAICPICMEERMLSERTIHLKKTNKIKCFNCARAESQMIKHSPVKEVKMFGCTLKMSVLGRCDKGSEFHCKHYLECLNTVENLGWMGWNVV